MCFANIAHIMKKPETISVKVDAKLKRQVNAIAKKVGLKPSDIVRFAIAGGLPSVEERFGEASA